MSMFEVFDKPQYLHLFSHGQYKNCFVGGSFHKRTRFAAKATKESAGKLLKESSDDFFTPCRPSDYLEFRVQSMLRFYQGPSYSCDTGSWSFVTQHSCYLSNFKIFVVSFKDDCPFTAGSK